MLGKHKTSLLELVRETGLNPREFVPTSESTSTYKEFRLNVRRTPLFYGVRSKLLSSGWAFDFSYSRCKTIYPDPEFAEALPFTTINNSFDAIKQSFTNWLNDEAKSYLEHLSELEEDLTLPDPWTELSLPESFTDQDDLENTPFSIEEQSRIADSLEQFETKVLATTDLSEDQAKLLHERIDYLISASKRLGRKDWLAAAAGAIMGYTFQVGLTAEAATQIIQLAGEALRWIAHTPLLLP